MVRSTAATYCHVQRILNAKVEFGDLSIGTVLDVACNAGYQISTHRPVKCIADSVNSDTYGVWDRDVRCIG